MTHRAGQISARIVEILAASSDLGLPNNFADRTLSLLEELGEVPCTTTNEGADNPISDEGNDNVAFIDSQIDFEITGYAVGADEPTVKAELRRQRRYIHAALMADATLGLAFVVACKYQGAEKATLNGNGEVMAGSLTSNWRVHYRMNFLDPGD